MRYGENAKAVIDRVKERIKENHPRTAGRVRIVPAYDRSDIITASIETLKGALIEEAIVVSIVVFLFLLHVRSVIRVIIEIPVAVLIAFICMKAFGITSTIMSLGGIAIAIGVIVDASIVLVENAYRNVARAQEEKGTLTKEDFAEISILSAKQVGRAIFFAVAIMVVSFLPVFMLEGQEGKLFRPLAFTKTFVLGGSAIIAITLVPVLMVMLTRGKFRRDDQNPITRFLHWLYEPVIRWVLRWRKTAIALNVAALLITIPMVMHMGSEFMPPLDEEACCLCLSRFPRHPSRRSTGWCRSRMRSSNRFRRLSRCSAKSARRKRPPTRPGQHDRVDHPAQAEIPVAEGCDEERHHRRAGCEAADPRVRNGWTQPIINRINMLSTGVRTDLGVKIFGKDLDTLESLAIDAEHILRKVPGAADLYAERTQGGLFLDITIDRKAVARYGINAGDVQDVIETAIGGQNLGTVIDGRQRFPLRVRFAREWRDNIDKLKDLPVPVNTMGPGRSAVPMQDATGSGMGSAPSGGGAGGGGAMSPNAVLDSPRLFPPRRDPRHALLCPVRDTSRSRSSHMLRWCPARL